MTTTTTSFAGLALAVIGATLIACGGGADPTQLMGGASGSTGSASSASSATSGTDNTTNGAAPDGTSNGTSGGSGNSNAPPSGGSAPPAPSSSADAGTAPSPPPSGSGPTDVFTGAPAYVATTGPSTQVDDHPNGGNPAGLACFTCHGNNAPKMVMGGTVYSDAAGTTPLSQAEVRLEVGGTVTTAYTNQAGNFFVFGAPFTGTAKVGVRNAGSAHPMSGAPSSGDCNSCHNGTTTAKIHLP